jgi:hypothetical protein
MESRWDKTSSPVKLLSELTTLLLRERGSEVMMVVPIDLSRFHVPFATDFATFDNPFALSFFFSADLPATSLSLPATPSLSGLLLSLSRLLRSVDCCTLPSSDALLRVILDD